MRIKYLVVAFVLTFLLGLCNFASAQQASQGTIRGIVEDETGARLPGVTITVTSPALVEPERIFITEQSGIFRFPADRAARIAVGTVASEIAAASRGIGRVVFCCFSEESAIHHRDTFEAIGLA